MKSPVNWALLGLIIERESYAYELAQRFQRLYHDALALSSTSHVYTALDVLQSRALIEQLPGARGGRQPKPTYRATGLGIERYGEWLVGSVEEERRRQVLFVLELSTLAGNVDWVTEILDRYEQAWLERDNESALVNLDDIPDRPRAELIARLLARQHKLNVRAKLAWVRYARRELQQLEDKKAKTMG